VTYHTGIDWIRETIISCISEDVDLSIQKNMPVAAVIVESTKDGVFKGFDTKNLETNEDLLELEITAKKGDEVNLL
jgi:tRNA(Arg) A34 adenosine deaminase TadA